MVCRGFAVNIAVNNAINNAINIGISFAAISIVNIAGFVVVFTLVMVRFAIKDVIEISVAFRVFFCFQGRCLVGEIREHLGLKKRGIYIFVIVYLVKWAVFCK